MANVNVTYDQMQGAAGKLVSGQTEIETQLTTLKTTIDNLVTEGYVTDSSSQAFHQSYEDFNTGVTRVIEGLTGMSKYLNTAASTFKDADTQLASALNS